MNVVAAVDIITMTKSMNTTMMKNAAVVAAVNITIMNMKLMSIIITMRKNVVVDIITTMTKSMNTIMTISRSRSTITMMRSVNAAVAVDIITTMMKIMNIIMKQWSMSLVLCRQV